MKKNISFAAIFLSFFFMNSCTFNNVKIDDSLQKYFQQNHIKGTFALLDNSRETFTICGLQRYKDSSFAPGGSFNIFNSLVALETGRLRDEYDSIKNNSSKSIFLKDAFNQNDDAPFQTIASSVGKDTMQYWIDSLHYGKVKINADNENFWTNDSLKLTPDEQLGFVDKLYFSALPFQKRVQEIVRRLMIKENNTMYMLAYKASWNINSKGQNIGWLLGWIEENKHVYFFVINAESENPSASSDVLTATLKSILQSEGFFDGKK